MTIDTALMSAGSVLAAAFPLVLIWKRIDRTLPLFTAYAAYSFLSVLAGLAFSSNAPDYLLVWALGTAVDTLFYIYVLMELGTAVVRYNRTSPPPSGILLLLFLAISLPIGMLTPWPISAPFVFSYWLDIRMLQATTVLEVAALLTLVCWSSFNKLRWPERELRLVIGMGSWALVQLCALVLHEQGLVGPANHWLDLLTPATFLCVLVYWLHYFLLNPGSMTEIAIDSPAPGAAEPAGAGDSHHCNKMGLAEQE